MELKKIQLVPLTEEQQKAQDEWEIRRKEQIAFLTPLLDSYSAMIKDWMLNYMHNGVDIEEYIRNDTLVDIQDTTRCMLRDLNVNIDDEDNNVRTMDFFLWSFYLHCKMMLEIEKQKDNVEIPTTYATELEAVV